MNSYLGLAHQWTMLVNVSSHQSDSVLLFFLDCKNLEWKLSSQLGLEMDMLEEEISSLEQSGDCKRSG